MSKLGMFGAYVDPAVTHDEVLQAVEIAAEGLVLDAKAAVAAAAVNENDREAGAPGVPRFMDLHGNIGRLDGQCALLALGAHGYVFALGTAFRDLVATVQIAFLAIVDLQKRTIVALGQDCRVGKQFALPCKA